MPAPDHIVDAQQLLLPDARLPYAGWYADPLAQQAAAALHVQARQAVQRTLAEGISGGLPLAPRLAELIAGFWLGRAVALDYRSLSATQPPELQALVELVYGQLLLSRKLAGALEHLDRGFILAVPHLAPAEYFALLRRHELLRALPLRADAALGQTLPDLLTEARVIRRLQPAGRRRTAHPHDDTLG
ncbi:MAG TPA: hypothetical protein VIR60_04010 [Gammaproteobacteria bacterium]